MTVFRSLLLLMMLLTLSSLSCDDYNIVEPRFYVASEVEDRELTYYDGFISFGLPYDSIVTLYILGSAGNVIKMIYENKRLNAGNHSVRWNWRDDDGNKYPDGIYCVFIKADGFTEMNCFEHNDTEDYLP